jgi:hypothetical protein
MWAYEQGEKEEPYVHASSYIEPMDLAASCWTAFLHIASLAFFAPFIRHRSVSCSLPCTLTSSVVLVMERVSPTAYLSVLICVFVADLAAIPSLHWQRKRLGWEELFRQLQTWIMVAKYVFDSALVILMVLYTSKGVDDGK